MIKSGQAVEDMYGYASVLIAIKHTLLYRLFYSEWDLDLQTEHYAVLKKT